MNLDVQHNEKSHQYSAKVQGDEAVVTYMEEGDAVVFTHTLVPEAMRGQGVGEELVRQAVEEARGRGREVLASCPFVQRFLEQHPEYQGAPARS